MTTSCDGLNLSSLKYTLYPLATTMVALSFRLGAKVSLKTRGCTWSGMRMKMTGRPVSITAALVRHTLTVGDLGSLCEVMLDLEALRLRILCVGVLPIGDKYLIVGDPRVAQILGLCRTLVAEPTGLCEARSNLTSMMSCLPKEDNRLALQEVEVGILVVVTA